MALAIIASLPVDSHFVPTFLENIIDKRVAGVALNILERFVNWLCSWVYFPYNTLYRAKMARVHLFSDGIVKLIDATARGVANVQRHRRQSSQRYDYISLHDRTVHFNQNPHIRHTFARNANTDYVVVKDDPTKRANWYQIIEQEIPRQNRKPMEKIWLVDANEVHRFPEDPNRDVFLVERNVR